MSRRLLLTTALLSLFVSDIAMAQQGRPEAGRPGGASGQPGFGRGGGQGGAQRPGGGGGGERPGGGERRGPVTRPSPVRPGPGNGGAQVQPPRPGRPTQPLRPVRPPRPEPQRPSRPRPPHRPGAGRPPHFRPVHGNPFSYPRGYTYRRWTIGLLLPSLFLSSNYYYSDYNALGVGPPPIGYRWVRYGPDLLLVSSRTGRIADVIYGAFY
jgi:Ni/Co efflux regulator RcnB